MATINIDSGAGYASLAAMEIDFDSDSPLDSTVANTVVINEGSNFNAGNMTWNHTGVGGGTLTITTLEAHRSYGQAAWPDDQGPGDMITALTQGGYGGTLTDVMGETFILDNLVLTSSSDILSDATGSDFTLQYVWLEGTGGSKCINATSASTLTLHDSIFRSDVDVSVKTAHASIVLTAKNCKAYSLAGTAWWKFSGTTFDVNHCIGWVGDQTKSPFLNSVNMTGDYNISTKSSGADGPNDISAAWLTATAYTVGQIRTHNSEDYLCWVAHTSASGDEPGVGASWETKWLQLTNVDPAALFVDPNRGRNLHLTTDRIWPDGLVFGWGAEEGNADAWDTTATTVEAAAALTGTLGSRFTVETSGALRQDIGTALDELWIYWQFRLKSGFAMGTTENWRAFLVESGTTDLCDGRITAPGGQFKQGFLFKEPTQTQATFDFDVGTIYKVMIYRLKHVSAGIQRGLIVALGSNWPTTGAGFFEFTGENTDAFGTDNLDLERTFVDAGTSGDIHHDMICIVTSDPGEGPGDATWAGDTAAKLVGANGTGSTDFENRARVSSEWNIGPFQIAAAAAGGFFARRYYDAHLAGSI
jgi:hypothetical protein